jgi:cysteine synthase A
MVIPAESPHGIQGIGDGRDFLAKQSDMDGIIHVKTEDAINRAKLFVKESGILIGISSGANLVASEKWIADNNPNGIVVTMLCDRGERYLTLY